MNLSMSCILAAFLLATIKVVLDRALGQQLDSLDRYRICQEALAVSL